MNWRGETLNVDFPHVKCCLPNIHGKKIMLCIWRDLLGVVYHELLKPNETITGAVYRTHLMRLNQALKEKRTHYYSRHDKVILLHDNARPHVAAPVKNLLGNTQVGSFIPPAVFIVHFSFWFSLISIDNAWFVWAALRIIWKYQKLGRLVNSLKRWSILPTWYLYAARKMGKNIGKRWTILRKKYNVPFFTVNA